jgi:hypothetical protein
LESAFLFLRYIDHSENHIVLVDALRLRILGVRREVGGGAQQRRVNSLAVRKLLTPASSRGCALLTADDPPSALCGDATNSIVK